jgi:ubiquinone/menaquinone biosynthesis C-methylase UbiE
LASYESVLSTASTFSASTPPDVETSSADYARRFSGPAGDYLLDIQARAIQRALHDLDTGSALDVGGGHGQLVDPLRSLGWRVTVHGSDDVCASNLRELHGKRDCEFLRGSFFALPVPDRSFDLVLAVRLVSHVDDWPRLLSEMCRVARHTVIIDHPSKVALNALTPLLFGVKKSFEGNTRPYLSFSRKELMAEFSRHGFAMRREIKQFFLPMAVHRLGRGGWPYRAAETAFRSLGLTALAGSPVILRVDRIANPKGPTP